MPIESEYEPAVHNCIGGTEYSFTFKIFETSELKVYLRDTTVEDPNVGQTLLVEGAGEDYTVSAPNNDYSDGGKVTTTEAYGSGYKLIITRDVAETQTGKYIENDNFPSSLHQNIVDKLCMLIQERKAIDVKLLRLAITSAYSNLTIPDPVANYLLAWKADLTGLKNVTGANIGDLTVSNWIKNNLLDDADAATAQATLAINKTRYYAVSLAGWSTDDTKVKPKGSNVDFTTGAGVNDDAYIPVNLPNGAIITELKGWIESDGSVTLTAYLYRSPLAGGANNLLAQVASSIDAVTEVTDSSIDYATIDNETYEYYVFVSISASPGSTIYLKGLRIKYTITDPTP